MGEVPSEGPVSFGPAAVPPSQVVPHPADPREAERWAPVDDALGYEVSNLGRVRSLDRTITNSLGVAVRLQGRILKPGSDLEGRLHVGIRQRGRQGVRKVHVLVAVAFLGPRPPGMEVCHDDGDLVNNAVSNLRWDTHSANCLDSVKHGTHERAARVKCPRGHPLKGANLAAGHRRRGRRSCLACERAGKHLRRSDPGFQQLADQKYTALIDQDRTPRRCDWCGAEIDPIDWCGFCQQSDPEPCRDPHRSVRRPESTRYCDGKCRYADRDKLRKIRRAGTPQ